MNTTQDAARYRAIRGNRKEAVAHYGTEAEFDAMVDGWITEPAPVRFADMPKWSCVRCSTVNDGKTGRCPKCKMYRSMEDYELAGGVAQSVEHTTDNREVAGSIPASPTMVKPMAWLGFPVGYPSPKYDLVYEGAYKIPGYRYTAIWRPEDHPAKHGRKRGS